MTKFCNFFLSAAKNIAFAPLLIYNIFGLDGVLLAWILLDRQSMPDVTPKRVILMIALSLYSGFTAQNIDNAAHVGGLVTGFLAGLLFCALRKHRRQKKTKEVWT